METGKIKIRISGRLLFSIMLVFLSIGCQTRNSTREPTRWNGPTADGYYPDEGLLKEWPEEGPEILWTYDSLGIGFSSAIIQNNSLYITGMIDSTGYLYKLNLQGELIYSVPYGVEWTGSYPGTRGSPTVVGEKLYLVSGKGKLICFNNSDGAILWSREYFTDFDGENIIWGINEAPVVDGDFIYATPGGPEYNVVALDRHTGDLVWNCRGEGELSAYCTPLLINHNGRKLLVTYTAAHLLGIDAFNGELLWSVDVPREWDNHFWTPIYQDGEIFYPTGRELGGGMVKLTDSGDSVTEQWVNQVCDYRVSAIEVDGFIYGSFSDYKEFTWHCINWGSGEEMWNTRELAPGRAIWADGMLYLYTYRGELALVDPDPQRLKVISKTRVSQGSGIHQAHSTMHLGVLYIRHGNSIISYKV